MVIANVGTNRNSTINTTIAINFIKIHVHLTHRSITNMVIANIGTNRNSTINTAIAINFIKIHVHYTQQEHYQPGYRIYVQHQKPT